MKKITFEKYLNTPIALTDTLLISENSTIRYIPVEVVRRKLKEMQSLFGVKIQRCNFQHTFFHRKDKGDIASGSVEIAIILKDGTLYDYLSGAASFGMDKFDSEDALGEHYAPILLSFATRNALKVYPAFGSELNTVDGSFPESYDLIKSMRKKNEPDILLKAAYDKAVKEKDVERVKKIEDNYNVG